MNIADIPDENTVEITRDRAREWVYVLSSNQSADFGRLSVALDYAAGEFDKPDGCKFVLIRVV